MTGRIVLDYKREPIRALELPLTVSSKIGNEEARLEAKLRFNPGADWSDRVGLVPASRRHLGESGQDAKPTKHVSGPGTPGLRQKNSGSSTFRSRCLGRRNVQTGKDYASRSGDQSPSQSVGVCCPRFRSSARLLLFDPESGSKALETYLPTTMTAKMVVKIP